MEPLKNNYNQAYIKSLVDEISKHHKLDKKAFQKQIFNREWKGFELKERMYHIAATLREFLPSDYAKAIPILLKIAPHFGSFEGMFAPHFVEAYGMDKKHWKISLDALEELTKYSSSEFAIRPFILADTKNVMKRMLKWSKHKNYHVRRLASEGCRPRLPWACALPEFKKDPSLILPILENLKNDPELYVRRSVANNLNDIAKDNPNVVLKIAKEWQNQTPETDWLIKHGLRTLLKKGDPRALKLTGVNSNPKVQITKLKISPKKVKIGESALITFSLKNSKKQKLRIEYAIHYLKANGSHSKKVFKISEAEYHKGEFDITRKQSFREMTTRVHYPGKHFVSIIVNGKEFQKINFGLA